MRKRGKALIISKMFKSTRNPKYRKTSKILTKQLPDSEERSKINRLITNIFFSKKMHSGGGAPTGENLLSRERGLWYPKNLTRLYTRHFAANQMSGKTRV